MGRPLRVAAGGYAYHVLNRANAGLTLFEKHGDYEAFEELLREAVERAGTRLLCYCLMPNHWHLVAWPRKDGELSRFVGWLTLTHTQRWHAHRRSAGSGHLYQGRFKSFPIEQDEHFYTVARYVERNALKARLVRRAEEWPWCSLHRWLRGSAEDRALLAPWPLPRSRARGSSTSTRRRPRPKWTPCGGRSSEARRLAALLGPSGPPNSWDWRPP